MYSTPGEPVGARFRSDASERLGLVLTVGGIILLGIVSPVYNWLLDTAANSELLAFLLNV